MFRDGLIILSISLALLVAAEVALRLIFPEKLEEKVDEESLAYAHDPEVIIALKPNMTKEFKRSEVNGGDVITWRSNSIGYRGKEVNEKRSYRIVVYGDSNVQARFSELENTFPYKLEQYLNNPDKNIEVLNAGLVGSGPDQSLLRFIREADVVKPDMVILHFFSDNDYGDIIRNRLFELDSDNNLVRTSFVVEVDEKIATNEPGLSGYLNSLLLTRAINSLFSVDISKLSRDEKVEMTLAKMEAESEREFMNYKKGKKKIVSHFADHYDVDMAIDPEGEAARTKILLMQKVLEEFRNQADKRNVQLLIVVQPAVYDVLTDNEMLARKDLEGYEEYNYRNLTKPIYDICIDLSLHCVHLIDGFLKNKPETLYFKEDNHWSDRGQDMSARITSDYILNNFKVH